MSKQTRIEDAYLGDGVYASFDGFHIVLDLREQCHVTRIALEPSVLKALNRYSKWIKEGLTVECE